MVPYTSVRTVGRDVVLVLAPHPGDEVFGCGGAIMRHVADGDPAHVAIVSDWGSKVEAGLDITDLSARKSGAMGCFQSQMAQRDYAGLIKALNRFRAYTLPDAVEAAEAYLLIDAEALPVDPLELYAIEAERQQGFGSSLANSGSFFGEARWRTAWRKISYRFRTGVDGLMSSK